MKTVLSVLALLAPALAASAATGAIDIVANGIPASASEVVVVIDSIAPAAVPDYEDPAAQPVRPQPPQVQPLPPANLPPPAAQPPPQGQAQRGRGRRGGRAAAAAAAATGAVTPPVTYRHAVKSTGAPSVTVHADVPAGANYRVRVVAIKGNDPFPTVLAGGKTLGVKVEADHASNITIALLPPVLKLASDPPTAVTAGAPFSLTGTLIDPSSFLGTKNRMRVWLSNGAPPAANFEGAQVSTVNVTTKDDTVAFNFELTAPKDPTTVYFQFGELSPEFAREDGTQAAFLVLPDLSAGGSPLKLQVQAAPAANSSVH